ncbi:unnamed protein product [Rotaria sp. Silwood1]|nr:unnamed protein product [Rotaria sp. Silwood1]
MKDEAESFESLKAKCIDMHDGIDHHPMITEPRRFFDPAVDSVDFQSKHLLENYTDILNADAVPVNVAGDGDCLFHSIHTFYPEVSIDELRARCVDELCLNEHYYNAIVTKMGLELVDDESVEEHVLRILNNQQYAGVLTLAALSSVLLRPIMSIYPHVNDSDQYFEILNTTFVPRTAGLVSDDEPLRIMWSGPNPEVDRIWRGNHFVPLLTPKQQIPVSMSTDAIDHSVDAPVRKTMHNNKSNFETIQSKVSKNQQDIEVEEQIQDRSLQSEFDSRQVFSNASIVINEIISAVNNNRVDDSPPQQVTYPSKFVIKSTNENRLSIGKDGNGAWIHTSSSETAFILTKKESYQIVRRDARGQFYYNERKGREYVPCLVNENDVLILKRF